MRCYLPAALKTFGSHAAISLLVALVAFGVAVFAPLSFEVQGAALLGIALSSASGAIALMLKRRAVLQPSGLSGSVKAVAIVFAARAALVCFGLWSVARGHAGEVAFVVGFFSVYLVQQGVELSYVAAAARPATLVKQ